MIATDLDGTLLRDDKTVSARTIAALAAAERAGIEVFFVTGRPARWMEVVSAHVHGHGLAICSNGAAVVDLREGGRLLRARELARRDALTVVRELRQLAPGVSFAVESVDGIRFEPGCPIRIQPTHAPEGPAEALLSLEEEATASPVLKLLATHPSLDPDGFLTLARTGVGWAAEFTRSSPTALLEVSGRGVSKASTLALCCAERGVSADQVVAFGDMPNDLEMLGWAGRAYAMANAHPEVLASTPRTAPSNEEDGVARVIEELLAG
ncbi:HAD family hydrolase [Streptomyces sp. NPDC005438]|uniref:HAD family hydrolase n=1 Tax=Streptomyces sp. NPDC005438 TaxID=3156880 RepID=UPI0033A64530